MSSKKRVFGPEVAVLGSARTDPPAPRWDQPHALGGLLAQGGFTVVTGGYGGLMSAVSQGVSEGGGRVVGLPMGHWDGLEPNRWNAELRGSDGYGARLGHLLRCAAVIALPGGVGTLSEVSVIWAAATTEATPLTIVLLGEGWPPLLEAFRKHLVVGRDDLKLLRIATTPEEAVEALTASAESDPRP